MVDHNYQPQSEFVDFVIKEASEIESQSGIPLKKRDFRFCTLTKNRSKRTINLRLPDEIQEKILSAYQDGKNVRIFA